MQTVFFQSPEQTAIGNSTQFVHGATIDMTVHQTPYDVVHIIASSFGDITENRRVESEGNQRVHHVACLVHSRTQRDRVQLAPYRMRGRTVTRVAAEGREEVMYVTLGRDFTALCG
ncbi:hypothetical protein BN2877_24060 [Achromobacter xylosoxidans]|nr:hypothetical protein BN2877_24060 [Achromobacter xylosoxidans]